MSLFASMKLPDRPTLLLWLGRYGCVFASYFATGKLGLLLPYIGSHITLIWLPSGIAVAALLRWGIRVWPGIVLGSFAVNMSIGSSPDLALAIAVGSTLAPVLAALLLVHVRFNRLLDQARDIFVLVVAAAIGMLVSATGGVTSLYMFGALPATEMLFAGFLWWAGDFVGVLLVAPFLLNVSYAEIGKLWQRKVEYASWLVLACLVGWGIFFNNHSAAEALPVVFLMLPLVVWSAMRFEITGASMGTIICMLIAALATSRGLGPFHRVEAHQGLFVMWIFLATLVLVQLMVTAVQTQRRIAEDRIRSLAFFDPLTQLPNRLLLLDRLRQAMSFSARNKRHGALMFLDLDHFKNINDTHGHDAGDYLLKEVARRLLLCVRQGDTVARQGGDEFVIVLENLDEDRQKAARQTESIAEKIRLALAEIFHLVSGQHQVAIDYYSSVSIGISLFRDRDDALEELLKRADLTMYQAKSAGRNAIRFFDPEMQKEVDKRAQLEAQLRHALEKNEFKLYYQLQVDQNGSVIGCEALLRWIHPALGFVSPADFIPLAENTGLILPIGSWVINQACRQLRTWSGSAATASISVAINVSARQFREEDFVAQIDDAISRYAIKASLLKLELTEGVVLYDVNEAIAKMHLLKNLGVKLSLDDFGTGYSSLSYLQRLPLDQLKIDQSFVRDLTEDTSDAAIVRTIITLGNMLGLHVIAEGVETQEQYAYLISHGCQAFQGYLFARPEPVEKLDVLLVRKAQQDAG